MQIGIIMLRSPQKNVRIPEHNSSMEPLGITLVSHAKPSAMEANKIKLRKAVTCVIFKRFVEVLVALMLVRICDECKVYKYHKE